MPDAAKIYCEILYQNETDMGNDRFSIDKEFQNLLPPLNSEDFNQLEQSIVQDGCRDALVIWSEAKTLIDGHNRFTICTKHGLPYRVEVKSFANRNEAIAWMLINQRSRRNLNRFQWGEIVLKLKPTIEEEAKQNQRAGVRLKSDKPVKTFNELAKLAGMGHSTLRQVAFILDNADDETIDRLRSGDANYSINGVWETLQEPTIDREPRTKSGTAKQRSVKSTSLPSPIPAEPPQDLAGHIIAALDELEQRYSKMHDRIDLYNMVGDISNEWAHQKKIELAMSQK